MPLVLADECSRAVALAERINERLERLGDAFVSGRCHEWRRVARERRCGGRLSGLVSCCAYTWIMSYELSYELSRASFALASSSASCICFESG